MEVCLCLELESVYEYLLMRAQVAMSKALEGEEAHPLTVQVSSICPPTRQHPVVGKKVGSGLSFWVRATEIESLPFTTWMALDSLLLSAPSSSSAKQR